MKHFLAFFALATFFSGCIKNNPDPSWITINEWAIEVNPSGNNAGVLSKNIPYASVYIDNKIFGIFELPCTIPVLTSGTTDIKIYPVINVNGISASKQVYPFLEQYGVILDLVQNETKVINPVTRYNSVAKFHIQDFEGANTNFQNTSSSAATMIIQNEGNNSFGRILLNASQPNWAAFWNDGLPLSAGQTAYLEIDYYNTNTFIQGVVIEKQDGSTINQQHIQMNAQANDAVVWKKIYIELTEIIGVSQGVYFIQTFEAALDAGDADGLIYIDNIKVVYN